MDILKAHNGRRYARWLTCVVVPLLVVWIFYRGDSPASGPSELGRALPAASPQESRLSHVPSAQREQVLRELTQLSDATMEWTADEMPAYWRMLRWIVEPAHLSAAPPNYRALAYHELIHRANRWRGEPLSVDLHICRVLSYPAPANSLGLDTLYEIWGWSDDSRGSLYVAVTPTLPEGIEVGESVRERGTFRGFFCKLQGYLAVATPTRPVSTAAPLMIGTLTCSQAQPMVVVKKHEIWHGVAGIALAVSFIGILPRFSPLRVKRRPLAEHLAARDPAQLDAWLETQNIDGRRPEETVPDDEPQRSASSI